MDTGWKEGGRDLKCSVPFLWDSDPAGGTDRDRFRLGPGKNGSNFRIESGRPKGGSEFLVSWRCASQAWTQPIGAASGEEILSLGNGRWD